MTSVVICPGGALVTGQLLYCVFYIFHSKEGLLVCFNVVMVCILVFYCMFFMCLLCFYLFHVQCFILVTTDLHTLN